LTPTNRIGSRSVTPKISRSARPSICGCWFEFAAFTLAAARSNTSSVAGARRGPAQLLGEEVGQRAVH
jgi:hypothetical protein